MMQDDETRPPPNVGMIRSGIRHETKGDEGGEKQ